MQLKNIKDVKMNEKMKIKREQEKEEIEVEMGPQSDVPAGIQTGSSHHASGFIPTTTTKPSLVLDPHPPCLITHITSASLNFHLQQQLL